MLAVNNYPTTERFARLVTSLEETGAMVTSIGWSKSSKAVFDAYDGVVLSGSPDMMSKERIQRKYEGEIRAMLDCKVPVLGVCFGHQMMAVAFGSKVVEDKEHVLRFVRTRKLDDDPLFEGMTPEPLLLESRHEVVESLPRGFRLVARSETTQIAAMKHGSKELYGVQSHPERYSSENPEGSVLLKNFVATL